MKHLRVKCLAQGHNILTMSKIERGETWYFSENSAPSGIRNHMTSSDIGRAPRSNHCAMPLSPFLVCGLDKLLSWFSTQTSVINFRYYLFCLYNVRRQYLLPGILGINCFLTGVPALPAIALQKGRICSLVNQVYTSFPLMSLPPFGLHWPNVG